jgi:hypothetical protein
MTTHDLTKDAVPAAEPVAWFIENTYGKGMYGWLHGNPDHDDGFGWTRDPNRAIRFCRKQDAEGIIARMFGCHNGKPTPIPANIIATEHGWIATPVVAAPQEPVAEVIIGGNGHIGILPLGPLEHEQPLYAAPRPRIKDLISEERQRRVAAPQEPTDADKKDAERYRWLRNNCYGKTNPGSEHDDSMTLKFKVSGIWRDNLDPAVLDGCIDDARSALKEKKE